MDDDTGDKMNNVRAMRSYASFRDGGDEQEDMFGTTAPIWIEDQAWDEAGIPQRPWVVPGFLMRGSVTVLSGPGSAGKSMLTVTFCCAIALGLKIGGFHPIKPGSAFVYNVEDDDAEQRRRFSASLRHIGQTSADIAGRIVRIGPHNVGTLLRIDPNTKRLSMTSAAKAIEQLFEERRPDVAFFDPFVELHDGDENDNTGIREVMAWFRSLARRFDCAICVLHHSRKGTGGMAGDPDTLRGASAIVGAARVVLTVMSMDEKEAMKLGVPPEQRRNHFRLDGAKSNYAAPEEAAWFIRVPYTLDNGDVAVAAAVWTPPKMLKDVTPADLNDALSVIDAGPEPGVLFGAAANGGGDRWAGTILMSKCDMSKEQAAGIINAWVKSGLLKTSVFKHPGTRKNVNGVRVDNSKRPTL